MLLLHQSAIIDFSAKREASGKNKSLAEGVIFIAPEGFEPSYVMMKTLCLNHLTIRPIIKKNNFIKKSSASIALASAGYKTATLLLC